MSESKTMDRIHKIMEELHEKRKGMTDEEYIKDVNESARKFEKEYKLNLKHVKREVSKV